MLIKYYSLRTGDLEIFENSIGKLFEVAITAHGLCCRVTALKVGQQTVTAQHNAIVMQLVASFLLIYS
jgi:hypothetical protein